jgi:mannose-1-phosphate guanylyltransferase
MIPRPINYFTFMEAGKKRQHVAKVQGSLWSVVLAGGEGARLSPFIQQWFGRHRPKQYCTFIGTRSMLQHTLDRADLLTAPDRKVTVIDRSHLHDAERQLAGRAGQVILQPANRDTAAGIFLPLTYVRAHDPNATVVIYPSDHFVYPEDRFMEAVRSCVLAVEQLRDRLFLLGVKPDGPEQDYGWICPGPELGRYGDHTVRAVSAFREKPDHSTTRAIMEAGALWNTFVMVAKVETLWGMGWRWLPRMMQLFEGLGEAIGTELEDDVLKSVYQAMPIRNFSSDLLQRAVSRIAVIELNEMHWSDWGRAERIAQSLRRIERKPAFVWTA